MARYDPDPRPKNFDTTDGNLGKDGRGTRDQNELESSTRSYKGRTGCDGRGICCSCSVCIANGRLRVSSPETLCVWSIFGGRAVAKGGMAVRLPVIMEAAGLASDAPARKIGRGSHEL